MMRTSDWPCVFSGLPADHLHHQSGRTINGDYLYPKLVVPLGAPHHVLEHQAWRRVGVGDGTAGDPAFLFLMRSGLFWVRLAEFHRYRQITLPAFTILEHGRALITTRLLPEARYGSSIHGSSIKIGCNLPSTCIAWHLDFKR